MGGTIHGKKYNDDSYALHTDLYQINMAQTYWQDKTHNRKAVFEIFFRKLPFNSGYAIFAGLEKIVHYLQNFSFSESDIDYLKMICTMMKNFEIFEEHPFHGRNPLHERGELVFGNEPILRVEAPLGEAQLIETALLNIVNYHTLVATKASRIKQVIGEESAWNSVQGGRKKWMPQFGERERPILLALIPLVMYVLESCSAFRFQGRMHIP